MQVRRFNTMVLFSSLAIASPLVAQSSSAKSESQATLQKEAKITMKAARDIAAHAVPGGTIQSAELEREDGRLIYSFDIKSKGKSGIDEVNVDAISGKIVAQEHESPAAEAAEARKESKAKAKQPKASTPA